MQPLNLECYKQLTVNFLPLYHIHPRNRPNTAPRSPDISPPLEYQPRFLLFVLIYAQIPPQAPTSPTAEFLYKSNISTIPTY